MATVMKNPPRVPISHGPHPESNQLRRDRTTAVVVLAIMAAVMALVIWLASLNGGTAEPIDYWPMMP